jgi:hypothetical protein
LWRSHAAGGRPRPATLRELIEFLAAEIRELLQQS